LPDPDLVITTPDPRDERVAAVISAYTLGAFGAMVAIPLPGADIAATVLVWGKMIQDIAGIYEQELELQDAGRLASDLFESVVLTTAAWFGSVKTASLVLKFIPGAGTVTAYVVDAVVAAIGANTITHRLGTAAALYFKSGRTLAPRTLAEHVAKVTGDSNTILAALAVIIVSADGDSVDA
jgi:uncharacterized protein (DUF697 family)